MLIPMAIIGVVIWWSLKRLKEHQQAWQTVAQQLRLSYFNTSQWQVGEIQGSYRGHEVRIWSFHRGGGKNKQTYTAITTRLPQSLGLGLHITPEGFFTGLGKAFGVQDIQVGDQRFDQAFLIKGRDEAKVVRLLSAEVRDELMRYNSSCGALNLTDEHIYWEEREIQTDLNALTAVLDAQQRAVHAIHQSWISTSSEVGQPAFWEVRG